MIKVIGFDLDNTLYNQELFEFQVFEKISFVVKEEFGIDNLILQKELEKLYFLDQKEYMFDKAIFNILGYLPDNWDEFVKNEILGIYRNYKPLKLPLFEEIIDILDSLKEKYKLALITNGNSQVQNNKIDCLDIRKYFDLILISDDYTPKRRKPDTFMFEKALDTFQIDSKEMVYVGDDILRDKASEKVGIKFLNINEIDIKSLGDLL